MSFDFFARGLHARAAVARLHLRQLGFLVLLLKCNKDLLMVNLNVHWLEPFSRQSSRRGTLTYLSNLRYIIVRECQKILVLSYPVLSSIRDAVN